MDLNVVGVAYAHELWNRAEVANAETGSIGERTLCFPTNFH